MDIPTRSDRTRAMQVFDLIRAVRNARISDMRCPEEYEAWSRQRRKVRAFTATHPLPDLMTGLPPCPSWHGWTGYRWHQTFAATPEKAAEGRSLLSYQTRGPLFPPSLWDRFVEAERAMAPVTYAVIACCMAFAGFMVYWSIR